ncbi:MAG: 2,3-bisphosphoglycerate-independent phosphoglycerate mutase [Candidatus Dormibacteria bacterium]
MSGARPFVLVILDGYGCSEETFGNAIAAARTPHLDALLQRWPWTTVKASGEAVGLPEGQQGNSEVGHLTIGTGRVLFQPLTRISRAIRDGSFFENAELTASVDRARDRGGWLHCLGLVSDGGVHSVSAHGVAVADLARRRGLNRVAFHVFTDGRDVAPSSGAECLRHFLAALGGAGASVVGSVSGRYWAMDRDTRWDRVQRAYEVIAGEAAASAPDPLAYVESQYAQGVTDEFIAPVAIIPPQGRRHRIEDGDSVVFFNFRPDRARQLTHALVDGDDFTGFARSRVLRDIDVCTFTEYERDLPVRVAFGREDVDHSLAEEVAGATLHQFHVAETEKYAHVTYFINGGREEPFAGEERLLVPSPRVATYEQTPAMSAEPVTEAVVSHIDAGIDDLIVVNYANPDMVGHTGVFDATVAAVECVDACVGRVAAAVLAAGGALLVTADHGNAEHKVDPRDGSPLTAHTTSEVPVILAGTGASRLRGGGGLEDVAPTVLAAMGLPVPEQMTGRDLAEPG